MSQQILQIDDISNRRQVRRLLKRLGRRVLHDSGGHFMVIDLQDTSEKLTKRMTERLPEGVRLISADKAPKTLSSETEAHEALFVRAIAMRTSNDFRNRKAAQSPGDSPEEEHIYSAPCMEED